MEDNLLDLDLLHNFHIYSPLVHCMTNNVVQNFTANILSALGASPAMVVEFEEVAKFVTIADALLINVGTITKTYAQAMRCAIENAVKANIPWILDPVAAGDTLIFRTNFCKEIIALKPTVIRANASEILALSGISKGGRGIDSIDNTDNALCAAQQLSNNTNAIVVVTGEKDCITDGHHTIIVTGGSPFMTKVIGTGCALSAVIAAVCALPGNRFCNIASVCKLMKYAGTIAIEKSDGIGSFAVAFIDVLYQLGKKHETF